MLRGWELIPPFLKGPLVAPVCLREQGRVTVWALDICLLAVPCHSPSPHFLAALPFPSPFVDAASSDTLWAGPQPIMTHSLSWQGICQLWTPPVSSSVALR